MRQPDTSGTQNDVLLRSFSLHVVCSWRDDMQRPWYLVGMRRILLKWLNNTVNNPIVLVLALAVVVLAFGIYLVAF